MVAGGGHSDGTGAGGARDYSSGVEPVRLEGEAPDAGFDATSDAGLDAGSEGQSNGIPGPVSGVSGPVSGVSGPISGVSNVSGKVSDGKPGEHPGGKPEHKIEPLPGAVLFACTLNSVRSVMAAGILRHLMGRRIYVASAGVKAGEPDPFVQVVMDEIGIDTSEHSPHTIADLQDTTFDLVVSLSPEAHHQALELTRTMAVDVEYWPTFDATLAVENQGNRQQILEAYREVRDQLFARVRAKFPQPGSLGGS